MAEIQQKDDEGKKKNKQKKMKIHVDFTPMVDMNMLLICFFMLATSMSKPQTMEISMPTKDKVADEEKTEVQASRAITVLLGADSKVYYYTGQPDYTNYQSVTETDYSAAGLRAFLVSKNQDIVNKIEDLKKKKLNLEMTDEDYKAQASEIKNVKTSPIVIIKATDDANYENLVDVLDEMQICSISKYAIVDITEEDKFLIENYKMKGAAEIPASAQQ